MLLGESKVLLSQQEKPPNWTFKSRTKLGWFPSRETHFMLTQSPGCDEYSPKSDPFKYIRDPKFSVGKNGRFKIPSHRAVLDATLPCQYTEQGERIPGKYKQQAIGFGKRYDFTKVRPTRVTPGPKYDDWNVSSISAGVRKKASSSQNSTFYYKW